MPKVLASLNGELERRRHWIEPALLTGLACLAVTAVLEVFYWRAEGREPRQVVLFKDAAMTVPTGAVEPAAVQGVGESGPLVGVRARAGGYSPIIRWSRRVELAAPNGSKVYCTPGLEYSTQVGTPRPRGIAFEWLSSVLAAVLAAVGVSFLARGKTTLQTATGLALLRAASILWLFSFFGFFTVHARDETQYLEISRKLTDWGLTFGEYPYTLGLPLLYLPLTLFWHAPPPFLFAAVFSVLSFLVFSVGLIALGAFALERAGVPRRTVAWCGATVILYPVVASVFAGWLEGASMHRTFLGQCLAYTPDVNYMSFYYASDFIGWNSLSDTPAMACALAGLWLVWRAKMRGRGFFLAGALLGFACLIRIASVFCLLPAAWLMVRGGRRPRAGQVAGLVGGLAVMVAAQMLWNLAIFGNPLTLGYQSRPEIYKGFQYAVVGDGVQVLGSVHLQLMAWAGYALICLARRWRTAAELLAILIVPTLIFYTGHNGVGTSPVRFVLLPVMAMLTAVGLHLAAAGAGRSLLVELATLLAPLVVVPGLPAGAFLVPLPEWLAPVLFGGLAVASVAWRRDWRRGLYFGVLATTAAWAAFGMICAVCLFILGWPLVRWWDAHRKAALQDIALPR